MNRRDLIAHLNELNFVYRESAEAAYSEKWDANVKWQIYVGADCRHSADDEVLLAFHVISDALTDEVKELRLDLGGLRRENDPRSDLSPMHVAVDPDVIARAAKAAAQSGENSFRHELYVLGQRSRKARQFAIGVVEDLGLASSNKRRKSR